MLAGSACMWCQLHPLTSDTGLREASCLGDVSFFECQALCVRAGLQRGGLARARAHGTCHSSWQPCLPFHVCKHLQVVFGELKEVDPTL